MDNGNGQSKEIQEEMDVAVQNPGTEGGESTDIEHLFQGFVSSRLTIRIRDLGGDPPHWQYSG